MSVQPLDMRVIKAFSTPLATYRIDDCAPLNAELKRIVLAAEQCSPSLGRSNIGGWRSDNNFLTTSAPALEVLLEHVQSAVMQLIKTTAGEHGFTGYLKISGWANVLRNGNYNTIHNHPDSAWSGVYYVDVGSQSEQYPLSGLLELIDPRPGVDMVSVPGTPFGQPVRIQPEAGLMLLFPSWLQHQVHPYVGGEARISIAFNVSTAGKVE